MSYKGYIERLKANHPASDAWWDSPTTTYKTHKETLLIKYPSAHTYIDYLMPDDFSSTGYGLSSVTTNPRLVAKAILTDKDYWGSRFDASTSSCQLLLTQLSTAVVRDGAAMLSARWRKSAKTTSWISAQVDPINVQCIVSAS
ncbi:hypothetical protein [Pseudomonas syringae]|uniref:Uncharacterized protein n=1 Tax=Pseudomonas syringae pv. actinidifoliorum ICMP 18803 TaxID=1194400 RepID=A0AAT9SG06_PSESX|nr:hypothetical protein [Pseudomonas syringae]UYS82130.1 hypothetical protein A237_005370 [Pseudomonas syringae pv. actinidifoliorum ICMP 18803]